MRKRSKWSAALIFLGVPTIVILGLVFGLTGGVAAPQHIRGDVIVGPIRLQGADRASAAQQLATLTPEQAGWGLRFVCGDRAWQPTAAELGVSVDVDGTLSDVWRAGQTNALGQWLDRLMGRRRTITVPVRLRLDEAVLRDQIGHMAAEVSVPPRNASFDLRSGRVVPEADGHQADIESAVTATRHAVQAATAQTIEIALTIVPPTTKAADLAAIGGTEIARFETWYRADAVDRSTNIALAVARLSGTIVKPGQVFSFNETVGPRTRELGYREALEIVNNQYVPGLGGGVCQVSSTMYNAGLLAGMNVVERTPHSRKPLYVEPGRDATVVYGSLDLKLRNDRRSSMLIAAYADNGQLCISIRGLADPAEHYDIETTVVETIPATTKQEPDATVQPGKPVVKEPAVDGLRVLVFRVARVGGKITRSPISNDYYAPVTGIIKVAPGDLTLTPSTPANPAAGRDGGPEQQLPPSTPAAGPQ